MPFLELQFTIPYQYQQLISAPIAFAIPMAFFRYQWHFSTIQWQFLDSNASGMSMRQVLQLTNANDGTGTTE